MVVRMRTFGSILRTTSSLIASSTFNRIVAMQMLSSCRGARIDECGGVERLLPGLDDHQSSREELVSRMLSAVEGKAFGE